MAGSILVGPLTCMELLLLYGIALCTVYVHISLSCIGRLNKLEPAVQYTSISSEDFPDKPSNTHVICCSSDTLHPKSAKFTATAVDLCIAIEKLNQ